jgi:hypothetical protein
MNHFYIEEFYNMCCLNLTRQEILDYLNTCNCCDRHKINRPVKTNLNKKIEIKLMEYNVSEPRLKNQCRCYCNCRHYARAICEEYPIHFYINEIEKND